MDPPHPPDTLPYQRHGGPRDDEYPCDSGSPTPSDKEERAVGADDRQGTDRSGGEPGLDPKVRSCSSLCFHVLLAE